MSDKYLLNNVSVKARGGLCYEPGDLITDASLQSDIANSGGVLVDSNSTVVAASATVASLFTKGQRGREAADIMSLAYSTSVDSKDDTSIASIQSDIVNIQAAIQTFQNDGTASVVIGTPGSQTGLQTSYVLYGTTTDDGTLVLDLGYAPPDGHSAKFDGGLNVVDRTSNKTESKNIALTVRNFSGVAVAGTPIVSGANGDGSPLTTATIVFSIVAGTLNATLSPPTGYSGTLEWIVSLDVLEN